VKSEIPIQPSIALGQLICRGYGLRHLQNQNWQFLREDKSGVIIYEPIPESHVLNKDIAFAIIKLLEGYRGLETD
jgi:penicillin-binding protein 1A